MKTAAAFAVPALLAFTGLAQAQATGYGPELQGFEYPHQIQRFALTSQRQDLSMSFMDVEPTAQANGKTVLLLHGKNFCGATWEGTIKTLTAAGYRVIAPDQIGFCASSKPVGYQFSFAQLAANTHALLGSLGVEKPIVIGHSMGGMLATRYALQYADAVEKLVLVSPLGLEDWQAKGVPYATVDDMHKGELKTNAESMKAYQLKFYYDGKWKPEYDRWIDMQAGLYAGQGREAVTWNQAQTSEMVFTQPVVHEFPAIKVPTVLMIGGKDRTAPGANRAPAELQKQLGDYPALGRKAAEAIPGATLVDFPELGHSPQVEAPEKFHEALLRELAKAG
ncbi:alpha/beta hydrolase [Terrihabitans rhizophilus]|uniref:Alpha/beta hydrolase n=1 Tax=Terrihabitans rhizophilus TaxID=3092662 RepID=A0ABU4RLA4_9HYPH|nr:alpha/beta hydrolase [Terrihabitans sp. PJ23]MDX6805610.1 alpha/beta hydrolase [Terrihabitans sp. PJ23]